MKRTLSYYLALDYPVELVREDGGFVALHPDLPGCVSQGDSASEAVAALDDARDAWLRTRFEDGLPIEDPVNEDECSGRVSLRMSPFTHAELARISRRQKVSLNQLLNNILSEYVGGDRVRAHVLEVVQEVRALNAEISDLSKTLPAQKYNPTTTDSGIVSAWRPTPRGISTGFDAPGLLRHVRQTQ